MGELINLRRAKKARARQAARAVADTTVQIHGTPSHARSQAKLAESLATRRHAAHRREPDPPKDD
ncbi:MAG: DUF4169 family protein [Pseudomonadota bacterium]